MSEETRDTLNSDELGAKGEATFEVFCAEAKLICNRATRDRSGWDFVVDFPMKHGQMVPSLDQRENPISCIFQQKSMWDENDQIKFRLSSLERLAKDPRPTFIYVLKINKMTLQPTSAFLIHLRGQVLGKVLRKLRAEHAANRLATNNVEMSMNATANGIAIELGGLPLRTAVQGIVGISQSQYEIAKRDEISNLGFEQSARELNVAFTVTNADELIDVFFGKTKVKVQDFKTFETRFGIKLETQTIPSMSEIQFNPFPHDSCHVIVRRDKFSEPAIYRGNVFFAPRVSGELVARIETKMFEIIIRGDQLSFTSKTVSPNMPLLTPSEWRNFFLLADALATGGAALEIKPGDRNIRRIKHEIKIR